MQIVAEYPDVGRPVDDMDPELQEWPISFDASGYVVLYRLQQETALVVVVQCYSDHPVA